MDLARSAAEPVPLSLGVPDVTLEEPGYQNRAYRAGDVDGDGHGDWVAQHWLPDTGSFLRLRYGGPRPASDGEAMALALGGARLLRARAAPAETFRAGTLRMFTSACSFGARCVRLV
jgi:hypothetical protein